MAHSAGNTAIEESVGTTRGGYKQVVGQMITLPPPELQVPHRWDYWAFSVLQNPP
ncbi:hypothetical protein I79_009889 [Cricetulus griseus]|uniref:Uncharacterized protein n=1 Tax=Cricetulus griseus TaxID=10029 RepID=G3HGZ4_CRIGR|nr:hypothetical protein I79_009889 [Cricetulus griseus]